MKFYTYTNQIIKDKSVFAILMKHFYSQDIFVEVFHKNLLEKSFFVRKPKQKLFWRITDTLIQVLTKTFLKQDLRLSFGQSSNEQFQKTKEELAIS